jgi:hypothetical protein
MNYQLIIDDLLIIQIIFVKLFKGAVLKEDMICSGASTFKQLHKNNLNYLCQKY